MGHDTLLVQIFVINNMLLLRKEIMPAVLHFNKKVLLLCILNLTVLTSCVPQPKHFGVILLSKNNVDSAFDLFRIPDNTQNKVEQLTFTPTVGEYYLFASKNGDRIIFQAVFNGMTFGSPDLKLEESHHIYILDIASKKLNDITRIFTVPPITSPMQVADWSPDGKQFAVITYKGGLELMDFDGTNKRSIPIPPLGEAKPVIQDAKWSPDGKKLAVTESDLAQQASLEFSGDALLVYNLESGKSIQLASNLENCGQPVWSPDSQQLVADCSFNNDVLGGPTILRVFDTENPGQPYEHLVIYPCRDPSWSPDGKQIAFNCRKNQVDFNLTIPCYHNCASPWGVFITDSDGNGIRELKPKNLESSVSIVNPIWSPDGTQIVYIALTDDEHSKIYSVYPDGSNNRPLTNQEAFYNIVSVNPMP